MIANRRSRGTTSRKSSSRLAARSVAWPDRPVTLPPGRARLATKPPPTGSFAIAKTMGMTDVGISIRDDAVDLQVDKLRRDLGDAVEASLQPAIFDCNGATLDPAEFAQSLHKGSRPWPPDRSVCAQEPNGRQLAWLLRAGRERPHHRRAAEQRDEVAAFIKKMHPKTPVESIAWVSSSRVG